MPVQIVITDGYTLNPGDLSWHRFNELGKVTCFDRTPPEALEARCKNAQVIVTNKTPVSGSLIDRAPDLRVIAVTATGYNVVDTEAAKRRNVIVCNVPEYGTFSVAQHTFALLLELSNATCIHIRSVASGEWTRSADWSYVRKPVIELKDKVLGIIGLGRIGSQTARIATSFGMRVVYHRGNGIVEGAGPLPLRDVFRESDFVSLHCPLNAANRGFVNRELLSLMKPGAFLINTSRGQLIDEADLADALRNNRIGGAALDVLSEEPPPQDHPLLGLPNCLITPHNAWQSVEARRRIMETTFENVRAALAGSPRNVV